MTFLTQQIDLECYRNKLTNDAKVYLYLYNVLTNGWIGETSNVTESE